MKWLGDDEQPLSERSRINRIRRPSSPDDLRRRQSPTDPETPESKRRSKPPSLPGGEAGAAPEDGPPSG